MDTVRTALALLLADGVAEADWKRLETLPVEETWGLLRSEKGLVHLSALLGKRVGPVDWAELDRQLEESDRAGARAVCRWDAAYPARLRSITPPPPVLFYRGDLGCTEPPAVAVVGTRTPTPGGLAFARRLGRELCTLGATVVSGMARGIDTAAHDGALEAGGPTIAVMGTGIDVAYPPENAALADAIAASGCVVSEQLMGTAAAGFVFPRRNRIISGLSEAVVVVEGGVKSGALITARWALEQGRDVGAVPGFPGDYRSGGPNRLLREGAFVVEGVDDILANVPRLAILLSRAAHVKMDETPVMPGLEPDGEASRVYGMLARASDADEIAAVTGMDVERVQQILARLEIDGRVLRDVLGRFARR